MPWTTHHHFTWPKNWKGLRKTTLTNLFVIFNANLLRYRNTSADRSWYSDLCRLAEDGQSYNQHFWWKVIMINQTAKQCRNCPALQNIYARGIWRESIIVHMVIIESAPLFFWKGTSFPSHFHIPFKNIKSINWIQMIAGSLRGPPLGQGISQRSHVFTLLPFTFWGEPIHNGITFTFTVKFVKFIHYCQFKLHFHFLTTTANAGQEAKELHRPRRLVGGGRKMPEKRIFTLVKV